jgi:hypothetical protein
MNHQKLEIVKYENLESNLNKFFGDCKLDVIGKTDCKKWYHYYDTQILDLSLKVFEKDLDLFGYIKTLPKLFI